MSSWRPHFCSTLLLSGVKQAEVTLRETTWLMSIRQGPSSVPPSVCRKVAFEAEGSPTASTAGFVVRLVRSSFQTTRLRPRSIEFRHAVDLRLGKMTPVMVRNAKATEFGTSRESSSTPYNNDIDYRLAALKARQTKVATWWLGLRTR